MSLLPNPSEPIAGRELCNLHWRRFFESLSAAQSSSDVDRAIARLQEEINELKTRPGGGGAISAGEGIDIFGSLESGFAQVRLAELADAGGEGAELVKIIRDAYGRVAGTGAATTDDLPEGVNNLYFPEAPEDGKQYARKDGDWAEVAAAGQTYSAGANIVIDDSDPGAPIINAVGVAPNSPPQLAEILTHTGSSTGPTHNIPLPAVRAGDLLVMLVAVRQPTSTAMSVSAPPGWAVLFSESAFSANNKVSGFYYEAPADAPASSASITIGAPTIPATATAAQVHRFHAGTWRGNPVAETSQGNAVTDPRPPNCASPAPRESLHVIAGFGSNGNAGPVAWPLAANKTTIPNPGDLPCRVITCSGFTAAEACHPGPFTMASTSNYRAFTVLIAGEAHYAAAYSVPISPPGDYTFSRAALGRLVTKSGDGAVSYTIPPHADEPFAVGHTLQVANAGNTTGTLTIAPAAGVALHYAGVSGAIALSPGSIVSLTKVGTNSWLAR